MKQFTKYICVFLMLMGMSVNAWGTTGIYIEYDGDKYYHGSTITIDLEYAGDDLTGHHSFVLGNNAGWTSDYPYYGYIDATISSSDLIEFYTDENTLYSSSNCCAPFYNDNLNPTEITVFNSTQQYLQIFFDDAYYIDATGDYTATITIEQYDCELDNVLQSATITIKYHVTAACTKLGTASSLAVNTRYDASGTEKVRFTWTRGTNVADHADNQKFCYWPIDGDATCSSALTKSNTSGTITRSTLSTGHYGWSIQALGSGDYCNSDAAESEFCIDDVDQATPGGADGKSWTGSTLSLTSKRIGWTAISNAEYYIVNIINKSTSATIGSADREITTNSIDITGLTANVTYTISVVAYNACDDASNTGSVDFGITAYTVSFNLNGEGSNAPSSQMVVKNGKASTPSAPTPPTGKHLDGWYKEEGCTNEWDFSTDVVTANTTLYAKWVVNNYTISFNNNGGSGSMSSVEKAHNSSYSLPGCTFTPPSGKVFDHWGAGSAGGTSYDVGDSYTVTGNITFYAVWKDGTPTDYRFSCAELTLTPVLATAGTPIFITSTANKTVRSRDKIEISGSGLSASETLTFPGLPSKFAIKKADGTALATESDGTITADAYIFYTPGEGDTSDGLDKLTGITVSVGDEKPITKKLTQDIIGRHLPADFVIAGKKDNKWYALPADFSDEKTPDPVEIAVDDINNPSVAYTANTNIFNLYGQNSGGSGYLYNDGDGDENPDGEKIKLGMKNNSNKPLFAFASPKNSLKGDGDATVTNNIGKQYWWTLKQINTSITNPQDTKYNLNSSNNSGTLSIKNSPFVWGTYATGVEELRLIPASSVVPTEAYFVEWSQHGGVIEVDATGIDATSVVAHLGEATSSAITLVETKTSNGLNSTKYNYTVNFGDGIDFADDESNGAMLTLEWYNGSDVMVAVSNIVVPKIIASTSTLSSHGENDGDWSSAEVHVLPGVTLTANAGDFTSNDVLINHLEIYQGATVVVTKGAQASGTLKVKTLVLRNGWTRAGAKKYDVARLYITPSTASLSANANGDVWYSDWYIDFDQYYPIAVPWKVDLSANDGSKIWYLNTKSKAIIGQSSSVRLRYYDGASRANGGAIGSNWKYYGAAGAKAVPASLDPSKAYAMTARRPAGKAFSIIRMPLTPPSGNWNGSAWTANGEQGYISTTHKDTVYVVDYKKAVGDTPGYARGWNFIANPYMSVYTEEISLAPIKGAATTIEYVNIPDLEFQEYDQVTTATAKLKPASGFLIQVPEDGTGSATFGTANRTSSAPTYRRDAQDETMPEQKAYIVLNGEDAEDMMGVLIADKYTEEYETNADLEKLLGSSTSLKTYMRYNDMNMAYVAINPTLAQEWIPVTVRIPAADDYTYSLHDASIVGELANLYLIDYANDGHITDLLANNYTFHSETTGTIEGRFAINAIVGTRETPTDIDVISGGGDIQSDKPVKFIYREKVYIYCRGVIYDATGKKVR